MRKSLLMVALAILVIGATIAAQAARLQYKDVAGTIRTYKAYYSMKGSFAVPGQGDVPMTIVMNFTVREKVMAVAADGTAKILDELKDGALTVNAAGQEQKKPFPEFQMTYDRTPQGKTSNMQMTGEGADTMKQMSGMGMNQNFMSEMGSAVQFPDKELAFGDTWKTAMPVEAMPGMKFDISALFKLTGTKVVDAKTYLQIDTDLNMNMPKSSIKAPDGSGLNMTMGMAMKAKSTTLFDEQAGALFSGSFNGTMTMTMSMKDPGSDETIDMNGTMTIIGSMKLVKVEKDSAFTAPTTAPAPTQ